MEMAAGDQGEEMRLMNQDLDQVMSLFFIFIAIAAPR